MNTIQRVLIVEDQDQALAWLREACGKAFPEAEVREAPDLAQAYPLLTEHHPDFLLVDLGLPDGSGIDLIDRLGRLDAEATIVVSTIFDDDGHLFAALRAGAQGYILKDETQADLVSMLRGIAAGRPPLSPSIARRLLTYFQPARDDAEVDVRLTSREREVLTLLAKGYTVARVAELLEIKPNTAAGYVKIIYKKLNISSRAEATLEAARRGFIKDAQ